MRIEDDPVIGSWSLLCAFGQIAGAESLYTNQTTLHPMGLLAVVLLGGLTLLVRRRYALVPLLVMICFIPSAQRVVIADLDFTLTRVIVLCGLFRVLLLAEWKGIRSVRLDYVLLAWSAVGTAVFIIQEMSGAAIVYRLGVTVDSIGTYVLCRVLLRSSDDLKRLIWVSAWICMPVVVFFIFERVTQRNLFGVFGGVPMVTAVRDGRLRCQGAFSHPILAGCFWAALMPLFAAAAISTRRVFSIQTAGVMGCLLIIYSCGSSTPVMAVVLGTAGASFYFVRHWMRWVQMAGVLLLILLHFTMNGPVWTLLAKTNIISGSTGYHRYLLVDEAIAHLDEWWLMGTPSTAHWGWGLSDITNQYVIEGVRGGLATLMLFTVVLAIAFTYIGRVQRLAVQRADCIIAWGLGVGIFVHCTNFIGVSYFGQITVLWNLMLAMTVVAGGSMREVAAHESMDNKLVLPQGSRPSEDCI